MDKIKVNNQVVKMRKHVKRAKLFAINKFTKQLKLLQNKKGNDSQAEKNQRKVERLLEKIKILKKMMPDFVSKKALSKAQDWNALLNQKNLPLEDQCLAFLANASEVQKEVEAFHAKECHLVEKIPTLLLEWEMKSQMPKSSDKKKTASDIKKQKLEKIAKRKKSNFRDATFPNNVAVDKSLTAPNHKKRKLSQNSNVEDEETNEEDQNINLKLTENDANEDDQLNSESSDNDSDDNAEEFFTKVAGSKKPIVSKKQVINSNTSRQSVKASGLKKTSSENSKVGGSDADEVNKDENSESEEDNLNDEDQFDSELSKNSESDDESEEFFTKTARNTTSFESKKQLITKKDSTKDSSNVNSLDEDDSKDSSTDNSKDNISFKIESTEGSATHSQSSIFERLAALANRDTKKQKSKSKSNSKNTKAIKVLDLNELQDSEEILIQSDPTHSEELTTPRTVVPKKDSFFLNGNGEVESSDDDENNTNNYKHFQPKRKFSNFEQNARDDKFKKNNFGNKPRKSFKSFQEENFSQNENRFQNKGKDFNRNENRFQNKGKDFNRNENRYHNKGKDFNRNGNQFQNKREHFDRKDDRFQKNVKGDFKFKNTNKFDKSKGNSHDDSFNYKRENKSSTISNSFQSKKQSSEKGEKNVNLHPSWEAKKKLKEATKSGFQGKRIVFNE